MKCATVYFRSNCYYVHSSSRTTEGVWIATPPFLKVEADSGSTAIGEAIMQALGDSQLQFPHPTQWTGLFDPLLNLAGVKTWETFMRRAHCLNIEAMGQTVKLVPNENRGTTEGFEPLPQRTLVLSIDAAIDQVGALVRQAMELCIVPQK